ncbi:hypothetical protein Tco_0488301 [Tanacetum coccineum]
MPLLLYSMYIMDDWELAVIGMPTKQEDTAYLCLDFTSNHEDMKTNTPYPEDPIRCIEDQCRKPKENKAFVGGAWSDTEDGDEPQNDATCLMAIKSQEDFAKTFEKLLNEKHSLESENSKLLRKINDLETDVKKLTKNQEVVEPCKNCDVLTQEVDSLKCSISKLQDEALNFSKLKKSSVVLDDMLSHQDKEGLGFSKSDKTTFKAYDGGHVVFGSNLKGKVISGGNITHDSITFTNVEHVSGIAFNLISVVLNERVLDSFDIETDYGRTRDDPYSRRFDEYKMEFDNEVEQLANEYDLRIGTKGYSFDGGRIFVCITKPLDDALPLGRVNESRFMGMIRKEMDEEGGVRRKT